MQKTIYSRIAVLTLVVLTFTACGFHLRQKPPLPDSIRGVAVFAPSVQSRIARTLSNTLKIYQIPLLDESAQGVVKIELSPEDLQRRLLSIFPTGQVAEYELIYSVNYRVNFPDRDPIDGYVEVLREYQDDPNQVLAKSRELELVLSEMRQDAADRIIRLLPNQYSTL